MYNNISTKRSAFDALSLNWILNWSLELSFIIFSSLSRCHRQRLSVPFYRRIGRYGRGKWLTIHAVNIVKTNNGPVEASSTLAPLRLCQRQLTTVVQGQSLGMTFKSERGCSQTKLHSGDSVECNAKKNDKTSTIWRSLYMLSREKFKWTGELKIKQKYAAEYCYNGLIRIWSITDILNSRV